jgi:hypothetical protein
MGLPYSSLRGTTVLEQSFPLCLCEEPRFLAYASEQAPQSPEIATHLSGARNDKREAAKNAKSEGLAMTKDYGIFNH